MEELEFLALRQTTMTRKKIFQRLIFHFGHCSGLFVYPLLTFELQSLNENFCLSFAFLIESLSLMPSFLVGLALLPFSFLFSPFEF